MTRKVNRCVLLVVGLLLLTSYATKGADIKETRATLRGVSGVFVYIEDIAPEAERRGLSKSQVQADVELRLRRAGIRVLTSAEWRTIPGMPALNVEVNLMKVSGTELYVACVTVWFNQSVYLTRDRTAETFAPTWHVGHLVTVGSTNLKQVREDVADGVDRFINAYLSVNPR